jgi:hypothetical protein
MDKLKTRDPDFSSARFISRHEIGNDQIQMMENWKLHLDKICGDTKRAGQTMVHFKVQQKRVNRWLNEFKQD